MAVIGVVDGCKIVGARVPHSCEDWQRDDGRACWFVMYRLAHLACG